MILTWNQIQQELKNKPATWLVTGVAGFIGSHLLEDLLVLNQKVVGLDNLATGYEKNLNDVKKNVTERQWQNFLFIKGDICNFDMCQKLCRGTDFVLHQAALGSVPRSIDEPLLTHDVNVTGFINILMACKEERVKRLVYASSSAVYGDNPVMPQKEDALGQCLSPYAVTKRVNELYAQNFALVYGMESIGLRYFNVFGVRQDPNGAYAAVIPKWIDALVKKQPVVIFGDGQTTRDYCCVKNVVQANIIAALTTNKLAVNQIYNIACGKKTSLVQLFEVLRDSLSVHDPVLKSLKPKFAPFRTGDVQHSLADVSKASQNLCYAPTHDLLSGIKEALGWYVKNL